MAKHMWLVAAAPHGQTLVWPNCRGKGKTAISEAAVKRSLERSLATVSTSHSLGHSEIILSDPQPLPILRGPPT